MADPLRSQRWALCELCGHAIDLSNAVQIVGDAGAVPAVDGGFGVCPRCTDIFVVEPGGNMRTMTPAEVEQACKTSPGFVFGMMLALQAAGEQGGQVANQRRPLVRDGRSD